MFWFWFIVVHQYTVGEAYLFYNGDYNLQIYLGILFGAPQIKSENDISNNLAYTEMEQYIYGEFDIQNRYK